MSAQQTNPDAFPQQAGTRAETELDLSQGETASVLKGIKTLGNVALQGESTPQGSDSPVTETYFHGTVNALKPGDMLLPGDMAITDADGNRYASATTDERLAWDYAESAEMLPGYTRPREIVYKVVPSDGESVQRLGPQRGEVNSSSFTVVEQIDTKPGHQGTIPDVNWHEYVPYIDANHPQTALPPAPEIPMRPAHSPNDVPIPGLENAGAPAPDVLHPGIIF